MPRKKSLKNLVVEIIDDVPDQRLIGLPTKPNTTIHNDVIVRLDMQSMAGSSPKCHNLQVQVNNESRIPSSAGILGGSATRAVLVPEDTPWTPAVIKEALKDSLRLKSTTNVGSQPDRYKEK